MKKDTAWLFRRYRGGGAFDSTLEAALKREHDQLVHEFEKISGSKSALRRCIPWRLVSFDAATSRANRRRDELRFDAALLEERTARADLAEMQRFVVVEAELASAVEAARKVEALLGACFSGLPLLAILRRLRRLANEILEQGEVRKAGFVVQILKSQVDDLQLQSRQEPPPGLTAVLAELIACGGAEAAKEVRRLMQDGYMELARRVAEDLVVNLAVTARSGHSVDAPGGALGLLLKSFQEDRQCADSASRALAAWLEDNVVTTGA